MSRLFDESDIAFRATVRRVNDSTMPEVPASDRTIVVEVDEVIDAPVSFPGFEGSEITVATEEPADLEPGGQFVFFANAWLFGSSIAVQEVGRMPAEDQDARRTAAGGVERAASAATQRELRRRVEESDAVVAGRVTLVRPAQGAAAATPEEPRQAPVSEHDPDWQEALVEVDTVVHGHAPGREVTVLFPASMDVAWADAPKHRPGERGVWFLRTEPVPTGVAEMVPRAFAVTRRGDFQPANRLDEIRAAAEEVEG